MVNAEVVAVVEDPKNDERTLHVDDAVKKRSKQFIKYVSRMRHLSQCRPSAASKPWLQQLAKSRDRKGKGTNLKNVAKQVCLPYFGVKVSCVCLMFA